MAQPTKSDTAVAMANALIALAQQALNLNDAIVAYNARNTDLSPDTQWRQMTTSAVNTDGSIATADVTVNLAHPITVGGLNRAEADLLPGLTFCLEFAQFMAGTLPTARAAVNRLPVLHTLTG